MNGVAGTSVSGSGGKSRRLSRTREAAFDRAWESAFSAVEDYKRKHGCLPTQQCGAKMPDGRDLGCWITVQRRAIRNGQMNPERLKRLLDLGLTERDRNWEAMYRDAAAYRDAHGHLPAQQCGAKSADGRDLGRWVSKQAIRLRERKLDAEKVRLLREIGIENRDWKREQWESAFQAVTEYRRRNGRLPPQKSGAAAPDGRDLGGWITTQRSRIRKGLLDAERVRRLEEIGIDGSMLAKTEKPERHTKEEIRQENEEKWEQRCRELLEYRQTHGAFPKCRTAGGNSDDEKLYWWMTAQKRAFAEGRLSERRKKALTALGVLPDAPPESGNRPQWEDWAVRVEAYAREHGCLPVSRKEDYGGWNLPEWLVRQRAAHREGRLTDEQADRLETIGMVWDPAERLWEAAYRWVCEYREREGELPVGTGGVHFLPDGRDVGLWLTSQRRLYADGALSRDRAERLLAIGALNRNRAAGGKAANGWTVVWYVRRRRTDRWDACYAAAKAWYEREGNLLIPARYVTEDGLKLGSWISWLRTLYNNCPSASRALYSDEISAMESIGMVWRIFRKPAWSEWIEQVEIYVDRHGDLNVPYQYEQNGFRLSTWLQSQRVNYKAGLLSEERIASLNRYGMVWSLDRRRSWDIYYSLAKQYYEEYGNLLVPGDEYTEDGYALGAWISQQRERFQHSGNYRNASPMPEGEVSALNAIGMVWGDVHAVRWEIMYEAAKEYYELWEELPAQNSAAESPDGRKIGPWITNQRKKIRDGKLDDERVRRLAEIGIGTRKCTTGHGISSIRATRKQGG